MCKVRLIVFLLLAAALNSMAQAGDNVLNSAFRVYVFLSDGCPMCQGYAPELKRLAAAYGPKGVAFTGVFPNFFATDSAVGAFGRHYGIPFPLGRDPQLALTDRFGARITPEVFLTDTAGRVLYSGMIDNAYFKPGKRRGVTSAFYLRDALDSLLAQKPVAVPATKAIGCLIVRD